MSLVTWYVAFGANRPFSLDSGDPALHFQLPGRRHIRQYHPAHIGPDRRVALRALDLDGADPGQQLQGRLGWHRDHEINARPRAAGRPQDPSP